MLFQRFFSENFDCDITRWSSPLPPASCAVIVVLYWAVNVFLPHCFSALELQLTVSSLAALGLVTGYLLRRPEKFFQVCSFRQLQRGTAWKVALSVFLILLSGFIFNYWSLEFFKFTGLAVEENQALTEVLKEAALSERIIIGFVVILLAPVGEEIVFRRMLYGLLLPLGAVKAVLLTSFLFSIGHFYLVGIPGLFFLGLILQLLYLHSRNLWCPVQVHAVFNALSFVSVLFSS